MRRGDATRADVRRETFLGVQRGITTMALVWQGAWMLTDGSLRAASFDAGVGLLFSGAFVAWLGIALATLIRASELLNQVLAALDVALLMLTAAVLLVTQTSDKSSAALSMCLLTVGVAGLLLPLRAALPVATVLIALEVAVLLVVDVGRAPGSSWNDLLAPAYAIAVAVAVLAGRHFALAAARRSDIAGERLVALEMRTRGIRAVEAELVASERLLHETALNTLTAIGRGGGLDPDVVRRRCAESADAIEGMAAATPVPGGRDPLGQLSSAVLVAQAAGCIVACDEVANDALERVPEDVAASVIGALREGLLNAARHSGARTIRLSLAVRDGAVLARVSDDGSGFETSERGGGFGVRIAIEESMALVGGTSQVSSTPGSGTTVEVAWAPAADELELPSGANGVALPILLAFLGFGAVSLASTIALAERPLLDALALALAVVVARLALPWGLTGSLPPWRVLAVVLAAPGIYLLQQAAFTEPVRSPWADWSAEVMVGILLTVACVGPWWTLGPALVSWLATMGDPIAELTQPGTAVIVGGTLFARSVRRSHRAHVDAVIRRLNEEAAAAASSEAVRLLQRRYALLATSGAGRLLRSIAEGRLDPLDAVVREDCREEERFLRSLMRLNPEQPLHDLAAALLTRAKGRGVPLEIDLSADASPVSGELDAMRVACEAAVDAAATGDTLRLSARREGGSVVVRLVGTLVVPIDPVPGVHIEVEPDGSAVLEAGLG